MQYAKGQRVVARCPRWQNRQLSGTIIHSFQGLHYSTYYLIQPDDLDLPIGDATPDKIKPIKETTHA